MQKMVNRGTALSEPECWSLLASRSTGRLAVTVDALPSVVPVSYVTSEGSLSERSVFCYAPQDLRKALDHAVVALQVDDLDECVGSGTSVTAVGVAVELKAPVVVEAVSHTGLRPYGDADGSYLVFLDVEVLSGRRL